jgi:hypothetical protein
MVYKREDLISNSIRREIILPEKNIGEKGFTKGFIQVF